MAKKKLQPKRKRKPKIKPVGAPTIFTKDIGISICTEVAMGNPMVQVCKTVGVPLRSVYEWLNKGDDFNNSKEEDRKTVHKELGLFTHQYARARKDSADFLFDEINRLTKEMNELILTRKVPNFKAGPYVAAMRLRIDTLKWHMSKSNPKRYGDKLDVTSDNEKITALAVTVVDKETEEHLNALRAK